MRVLVLGGDAALWVALASSLGDECAQLFAPASGNVTSLIDQAGSIDAVVVVAKEDADEPFPALVDIATAGLERRTVVIAHNRKDHVSQAIAAGVGGFVIAGSKPDRICTAIQHVASGGSFYDAPAADSAQMAQAGSSLAAARALVSALELKDTYTGGHAERVTSLALHLAKAANISEALPSEALEASFLLHDVGKIGIPESILTKPAGLTNTERLVLQTHPILGERIVKPLGFPDCVRQVVRHHHERWDGTGYPDELSGFAIPPAARIFSIADVLDAMTSVRPYRTPVTFREAMSYIVGQAGTQFDPALCAVATEAFLGESIEDVELTVVLDT